MLDADEILNAIEALPPMQDETERDYLGASILGEVCQRKLWLQFHRYVEPEKFSPRMLRLFHRGQREEGQMEMYLRETGFEIIENCFSQVRWKDGFLSGAGDGVVVKNGERYCVEFKTHSDKIFKTLTRHELVRTHPKHFSQCQVNASKFDCIGTIYLAVNKNDDDLFCDVIMLDPEFVAMELAKGEYVTLSDKPPDRIASKPTAFDCKFCYAKDVCWGFTMPRVNCRNCTSATKHRETGKFGCELKQQSNDSSERSRNNQLDESGYCASHSFNPHALHELIGWEPREFLPDQRAVIYLKPDGTTITNGRDFVQSKDLEL